MEMKVIESKKPKMESFQLILLLLSISFNTLSNIFIFFLQFFLFKFHVIIHCSFIGK